MVLFPGWSLLLLALTIFPTSFLMGDSLSRKERQLMEIIYLGSSVLKSLILCIFESVGYCIFFPSTAEGNFADDGWTRHWPTSIAKGVILLLCSCSTKRVVFGFSWVSDLFSLRFLATRAISKLGSISQNGLEIQLDIDWLVPQDSAILAHLSCWTVL